MTNNGAAPTDASLRTVLLGWARTELRDLPWRRTRDPWAILVSETMLQQTQVSRVIDRWPIFLRRFPDPTACADAPAADLLREWAGLGYNRRALMLHRCATAIRDVYAGAVPADLDALLALPGVGPYTARAVLAFAWETPAGPVDTNIGRVLARLGGESMAMRAAQARADSLVPADEPWLWNQGIMELGALVCTKRAPRCGDCPVQEHCSWRGEGPDPAVGSAAVSKPQSRFEGSDRQLRGRLVDALRQGPVLCSGVGAALATSDPVLIDPVLIDPVRVETVVAGLIRDGLVVEVERELRLAGDY
ncbi:MAG: A/G-specific adenine glycosylase [Candidatus Aldehydirespiratoraceae bacterium]|jgi:A/G-specific adenine glycosylase